MKKRYQVQQMKNVMRGFPNKKESLKQEKKTRRHKEYGNESRERTAGKAKQRESRESRAGTEVRVEQGKQEHYSTSAVYA